MNGVPIIFKTDCYGMLNFLIRPALKSPVASGLYIRGMHECEDTLAELATCIAIQCVMIYMVLVSNSSIVVIYIKRFT